MLLFGYLQRMGRYLILFSCYLRRGKKKGGALRSPQLGQMCYDGGTSQKPTEPSNYPRINEWWKVYSS